MRIAVISDIHGNAVALQAVLQDLEAQGGADLLIIPGDFYAFGPAPEEVFEILQTLNNTVYILGNTDRYLLEKRYPDEKKKEDWEDVLLLSFKWAADQIGSAGMEFIANMPPFEQVKAGRQHLFVVHGSPRSDEEGLTEKTTAESLREMPVATHISTLICGHTHIPIDRMINNLRVINAGSVGLPFDGDSRACYVMLSNLESENRGHIEADFRRVPYDIDKVVEQFYQREHPAAGIGEFNVRNARPIGDSLIYTSEMRAGHKLKNASTD